MCYSLVGSCLATCCCSAFSSAFGEANPFLGHLLIFFISCIFAMIAKFVLEKNIEWPYTSTEICTSDACAGNGAVFRTSFGLAVFYAIHALLLMVPGCKIFHGFALFLKFMLLIALIVGSFWIDNDFFDGYGEVARVGSCLWLIIQTLMLVAWADELNEGIMRRAYGDSDEANKNVVGLLCGVCIILFGLEITGCALAIKWFAGDACHRNNTFVAISLIGTVVFYLLSMVITDGSLLTSAVVCFYTTYLLLTALYSDPDQACNSQYSSDNEFYIWTGIVISTVVLCYGAFNFQKTDMIDTKMNDIESANKKAKKKESEEKNNNLLDQAEDDAVEREQDLDDAREEVEDEVNRASIVPWDLVKFHCAMTLASLYVCMLFTGWGELTDTANAFKHSNITVWVNILTQWATFGAYGLFLAPRAFCPHRFQSDDE